MRCSCQNCGTYMVHSESFQLGCVCPECGQRCKQCLGTNTVISKDDLKQAALRYVTEIKESFNEDDEYRD